ncbi:MAG: DUF6125 family protein [Dehalococcoidia bacterium]|nr:DUF6125 family protein [Dehalococcoidia bacterium]
MREVDFDSLPREELVQLLKLYSRLFLALDGFWFLAAKKKLGYDVALDLDKAAWEGYFPYEAKKIRRDLGIEDTTTRGIVDSLKYSPLWPCMRHEIPETSEERSVFACYDCPSLSAMERGGYPPTCEAVGKISFGAYAKAINPGTTVRFLDGPPRKTTEDVCCKWEFTLAPEETKVPGEEADG